MNNKTDNYISKLIYNQNYGTAPYNHNLVSEADYLNILNENINIEKGLNYLVSDIKVITGCSIGFGTLDQSFFLSSGKASERINDNILKSNFNENTIIDIASITKIFTIISLMQLYERGLIDFNNTLSYYLPEFNNIGDLLIYDILRFKYNFQTKKRIDTCDSYDEAFDQLLSIFVSSKETFRKYNDFSAIIASMLVEKITSSKFKDYVLRNIIEPCNMNSTYTSISNDLLYRLASTDFEYRVLDDMTFWEKRTELGKINDEKARILSLNGDNLLGHSGLFSTVFDMTKFCKCLLNGKILSINSLLQIGSLHSGTYTPSNYSQHLGLLCYSKAPIEKDSEIYKGLSGNTIAISGYTGTYLMVDVLNQIYCFIGSNRLNNRITRLPDNLSSSGTLLCPLDNEDKVISKNYVYLKDTFLRDPISKLLLQVRFHEES